MSRSGPVGNIFPKYDFVYQNLKDSPERRCPVRRKSGGSIEIGRAPGVVQVTFLVPLTRLDAAGLGNYAREQYGLE